MTYSTKIYLILFFFLFGYTDLLSQKCTCDQYKYPYKIMQLADKDKLDDHIMPIVAKMLNENNPVCKIEALNLLIESKVAQNKYEEATSIIQKQELLIKDIPCDSSIFLKYYINVANYNLRISNFEKSMAYAYRALFFTEDNQWIDEKIQILKIIASNNGAMSRNKEANAAIQQMIPLVKKSPASFQKAGNLLFLSNQYDNYFLQTGNPVYLDSIAMYASMAVEMSKVYNNINTIIIGYKNLDYVCYYQGDFATGLKYIDSAMTYIDQEDKGFEFPSLCINKSYDYLELGQTDKAFAYLDTCFYYARKYRSPSDLSVYYMDASEIYSTAGDYKNALIFYSRASEIKDSIFTSKSNDKISELEQKYNKEKNERTIKELEQKQKISTLRIRSLIGLAIGFIMVIIIVAGFYRQRLLKQKQKNLEIDMRLNRARMNPHFFFNILSGIQTLSMEENKHKEVSRYLGKFAKIMRRTLENTYTELVTLEEECMFLNEYLELQKLRFPDKFTFTIELDEKLEPDFVYIPAMILQPFVENSIEHGFKNINYPGQLNIIFKQLSGHLEVTVRDNGEKLVLENTHKGYPSRALQIIKDRLYVLNKRYALNARYEIVNNPDTKGYEVKIIFPLIYTEKYEGANN